MTALGRSTTATPLPRGRLAENVLHFVRLLRNAGLPLGPAKVLDALSAVQAVGVDNRSDFREALASVLVSRHEHLALFDQAFDLFWRDPKLLEKMFAALLPKAHARTGERKPEPELPARLAEALLPTGRTKQDADEREVDLDAALTFSGREVLQKRDFATMTADELAQVKVEASQRFPIRLTGMALVNAFYNSKLNGGSDNPAIASQTSRGAVGGTPAEGRASGGRTEHGISPGGVHRGDSTIGSDPESDEE